MRLRHQIGDDIAFTVLRRYLARPRCGAGHPPGVRPSAECLRTGARRCLRGIRRMTRFPTIHSRKGSGGHGVDPSPWRWWSRVFDDCVDLAPEVDTVETGDECRRTSRCGVDEVLEPESALASDLLSGAGDRRRGRPTREPASLPRSRTYP